MDARRKLPKPRKKRDITIRLDLYQWIEEQIEKGKFHSFSHAVEIALEKQKQNESSHDSRRLHLPKVTTEED